MYVCMLLCMCAFLYSCVYVVYVCTRYMYVACDAKACVGLSIYVCMYECLRLLNYVCLQCTHVFNYVICMNAFMYVLYVRSSFQLERVGALSHTSSSHRPTLFISVFHMDYTCTCTLISNSNVIMRSRTSNEFLNLFSYKKCTRPLYVCSLCRLVCRGRSMYASMYMYAYIHCMYAFTCMY